jgi:hypothetical protein
MLNHITSKLALDDTDTNYSIFAIESRLYLYGPEVEVNFSPHPGSIMNYGCITLKATYPCTTKMPTPELSYQIPCRSEKGLGLGLRAWNAEELNPV